MFIIFIVKEMFAYLHYFGTSPTKMGLLKALEIDALHNFTIHCPNL